MRNLIPTFPREVCFPRRKFVATETEFYNQINKSNKLKNIYFSLYSCDGNKDFRGTHIDKIYFDFDADDDTSRENILKQVKKFSDYLYEKNYKHLICFSGKKGFHVYIFTTNYEGILYKKDCLYNAIKYFKDTLQITPDEHCKDLRRISRVPNTWHMVGKRYCIPLSRYDLDKGFEAIKEKAKEQSFEFKYYGDNLFDIAQFDYQSFNGNSIEIPDYNYDLKDVDKAIKRFPPCVQNWLLNMNSSGTWKARYYFAICCRDMGLSQKMCDDIAKKYFGQVINKGTMAGKGSNYDAFKKVNALNYAYERGDLFPNCQTLYQDGLCLGKCPKYNPNGSPMYK